VSRLVALICIAALALSASAFDPAGRAEAHGVQLGDLMVIHPTSRPNLPNRPMVVYVTIANDGTLADRLLGVRAIDFEAAELHTSAKEGDIMKMQPIDTIDLPAEDVVELAPGGSHIMLFGAKKLYREGGTFPIVFTFEKAGEVEVEVMVDKQGAGEMNHSQMGGNTGSIGN
jgi:hypothetical protein